jgi:hypothetical protein
MTTISATIVGGPSKLDLMLALFDRKPNNTRDVEFKFAGPGKVSALVIIDGIDAADSAGESWYYRGHILKMLPNSANASNPPARRRMEGYYDTETQQGSIRLLTD